MVQQSGALWVGTKEEFNQIFVPFREFLKTYPQRIDKRKDYQWLYDSWREYPVRFDVLYYIED